MDKADSKMEDVAKADEPGADGAEQKKQYLLDRIATSDGFKDAKAHKEDDAPAAAAAADAKATEEASSGEDASPPKRRRPLLVDNLEPLARHALTYGELVALAVGERVVVRPDGVDHSVAP